jgi:hypothetical protein
MDFRVWLEQDHNYDSEQDRLEHEAFGFVFDKLRRAAELALGSPTSTNKGSAFKDAMMRVWPESDQGRGIKFILPADKFPSLQDLRIRINSFQDESSADKINGKVDTIYVGTASLQDAIEKKDQEGIKTHLRRIAGSLNHEMTHLHHHGSNAGEETPDDFVRYMTNPGELRAHAKDYAYTWAQDFPGVPFDPQRFVNEVIPTLVPTKKQKATNYFVAFADPEKQSKYKHVADIRAAREQLIGMIGGYVNYYIKSNGKAQTAHQGKKEFQGFQMGDARTWQQRQQHLNSMGIDTTGWGRAEIMRGVKNKS